MSDKPAELLDRFIALYSGLERAYGQWIAKTGKARFIKTAVTIKQWNNHLSGVAGLGIVPIREDDTATWGALDIDIDDIDHHALAVTIDELKLPLIVCRSKSGGAHCYTFTKTPVKAAVLRKALAKYATQLGYGQSEIFPKQDTLGDGLGSWINLPYFASNGTNRYAVNKEGVLLTVEEFVAAAEVLKEENTLKAVQQDAKNTKGMPPCMQFFHTHGIPEGVRNEVLFNFAVFLKKSKPETWEDEFVKVNNTLTQQPLPNREIQALIKSIARKDYNYKCKVPLIANQCDRVTCLTLDFGLRDNSNYHEFIVGGITKVSTEPPFWLLEINGVEVRLSTAQLYNFPQVRIRCMEVFGGMVPPMKDEEWRQLLQQRMREDLKIQDAPKDAGEAGRIIQSLFEFTRLAGRSTKKEDIAHGIPVLDQARVQDPVTGDFMISDIAIFRSFDFVAFLQRKKVIAFLPNADLWAILRDAGCGHVKVRAGKRTIQAWYVPLTKEQVNEIRSATTVPEMKEHEL